MSVDEELGVSSFLVWSAGLGVFRESSCVRLVAGRVGYGRVGMYTLFLVRLGALPSSRAGGVVWRARLIVWADARVGEPLVWNWMLLTGGGRFPRPYGRPLRGGV